MTAKIAICASGDGSNFEALVQASRRGQLSAEIVGLIVNRPNIGAIARAQRLKVPHQVLAPKDFPSRHQWDETMVHNLRSWQVDWVILAGFLALVGPRVLEAFPQRVVNIHPSLLPKFGGAGMYGDHVHAAVLKAAEPETGITVHLIDGAFDQGRILAQERVAVDPGDTVATLSERVKTAEIIFYPRVINDLVTGRITIS
jgi:phosphoribosylglycinamide formyltransferase-1